MLCVSVERESVSMDYMEYCMDVDHTGVCCVLAIE